MALAYITGISGAGKSTVRGELIKRGYEAYGTDEDGIAGFINNETGEMVDNPIDAPPRSIEWRSNHTYKVSRQLIEKLALKAEGKLIFLCGTAANDNEAWDLFSKIIALTADEQTLKHRITTRTTNNFGKLPHEMESILEWHRTSEEDYRRLGAVLIDSTRPVGVVVEEILGAIEVGYER